MTSNQPYTPGYGAYTQYTDPWSLPPTQGTAQIKLPRRDNVSIQDYMQHMIYNWMLPYMDPATAGTTREWLARADPIRFQSYAGTGYAGSSADGGTSPTTVDTSVSPNKWRWNGTQWVPTLPVGQAVVGDFVNQDMLTSAWNDLVWGPGGRFYDALNYSIRDDMLGATNAGDTTADENILAGQDVLGGINWLREAINTARGALRGESTRAEQQFAAQHLATLFREAEAAPQKAGKYMTLFENMTNPVLARAPQSGIFGFSRTLTPPPGGDFMWKGISFRNPSFT